MAASSLLRSTTRCLRRPSIPRALDRRLYTSAAGGGGSNSPTQTSLKWDKKTNLWGRTISHKGWTTTVFVIEVVSLNRSVLEMKKRLDALSTTQQEDEENYHQDRCDELWRPVWFFGIIGAIAYVKKSVFG